MQYVGFFIPITRNCQGFGYCEFCERKNPYILQFYPWKQSFDFFKKRYTFCPYFDIKATTKY
jgi:hypothetical protein